MATIDTARLATITRLDHGKHDSPSAGLCVMEDEAKLLAHRCRYRLDGQPARGQPVEGRLWGRVVVGSSGCWEFAGGRDGDGYGLLRHRGKTMKAHRLGWLLLYGTLVWEPRDLRIGLYWDRRTAGLDLYLLPCLPVRLYLAGLGR